jgi:deoxyribose-phosphate aldolase
MNAPSAPKFIRILDLTFSPADAPLVVLERLCRAARQHGVAAVCVNGSRVTQACHLLENSPVKVSCLVGYPLGAMDADVKRYEAEAAIDSGAQELDVVLNVGRLKDGDHAYVLRELRDVVEAADERPVKVLLGTALLTREEKACAGELVSESGAHGVVIGGGLTQGQADLDDVKLLRETLGARFGIKAGVSSFQAQTMEALLQAGATRLGLDDGLDFVSRLSGI